MQEFTLPLGTQFIFDEETQALTLKTLLGMAASYNGRQAEDSRSGLCLVCMGLRRFEGRHLLYTCRKQDDSFAFTAADKDKTFRFDSVWTFDTQNAVVSCTASVTNTSATPQILRRAFPRWTFCPGKYDVYSQLNRWSYENQGSFQKLRGADIILKARPARSTIGSTPYCMLRDEETRAAIAFHVLPMGNWKIRIHSDIVSDDAPVPVIEAGLSDEDLFLTLAPGETLPLPQVLLQQIPDGRPENGAAPLHRHIDSHILPKTILLPPVIYNTWLYKFTKFNPETLRPQLAAARKIGIETFIIDAGWYIREGNWHDAPNGPFQGDMAAFSKEVRDAGMKFGFWMEPETWLDDIPVRAEHPEWFPQNSHRIDLTIPEAERHFHDCIADNVRKYHAEYIKIDFNRSVDYDESGSELAGYCAALARIFTQLHEEFPTLVIENCASGALRTDLTTSRLFNHAFVSDNADPYETLRIRQGAMLRMHPMRILNWITLRPAPERYTAVSKLDQVLACAAATWDEAALYPLHYAMISGLLGIPGFSGDLAAFDDATLQKMAEYVDFYKANRDWLPHAAVYPLTDFGNCMDYEEFLAFQVLAPDRKQSLVFVFTNGMSRRNFRLFKLKNLPANATCAIERIFTTDLTPAATPQTSTTDDLMANGLVFTMMEHMHIRHHASVYKITME